MGYSTSRRTVTKMIGHLRLLEKRATIKFNTDDPSRLAYHLREALHAATFHDSFKPIAQLRDYYVFEVHPGFVIARWTGVSKKENLAGRLNAQIMSQDPNALAAEWGDEMDEALSGTTITEVSTLDEIIGAMIKYGRTVDEVYFPDSGLNVHDKERLYRWAVAEKWSMIDSEEEGLTLTQKDVPAEICWLPPIKEEDDGEEGEVP